MEDTSNNNVTSVNDPAQSPVSSNAQDPNSTQQPVNTGTQYEVQGTAPEDLDAQWTRWRCLVCNYTYEGAKPLKKCPRCGNEDPDRFDDVD